nr:hypothetical protein [Deltaproteobacteria bacterium]
GGSHLLLISDERSALASTLRRAVAGALCDFQPFFLDARKQHDKDKLEEICALSERFMDAPEPAK